MELPAENEEKLEVKQIDFTVRAFMELTNKFPIEVDPKDYVALSAALELKKRGDVEVFFSNDAYAKTIEGLQNVRELFPDLLESHNPSSLYTFNPEDVSLKADNTNAPNINDNKSQELPLTQRLEDNPINESRMPEVYSDRLEKIISTHPPTSYPGASQYKQAFFSSGYSNVRRTPSSSSALEYVTSKY